MGGGLLQLVAYGAQDANITGNPQITFWMALYKRHTNFAMEPFRVNLTGQANWGVKHSAILGRHADLLYSTYIEVVLPAYGDSTYKWNNAGDRLGYNLIKYAEIDVGGNVIDRQYGEFLFLWDTLTSDYATSTKLYQMVGAGQNGNFLTGTPDACAANGRPQKGTVLYIPLFFFYTRSPGAALPLVALQYHEVKINIQWNDATALVSNFGQAKNLPAPAQAALYIDYIYLDTEERKKFAQTPLQYLIEQTQFNEDSGITTAQQRIDLTFNHPVKELIWVVQPEANTNCSTATAKSLTALQPFTYTDSVYEQYLQINGQDRVPRRFGDYFSKVQPYQHHSGLANNGIYCYSFALRPEEHQPSGTCNFSRIDTATLVLTMDGSVTINDVNDAWNVRVYAVNYNVLNIMSGMAGLAYSN